MARPKVFIVYYSVHGQVHTLAQVVMRGVLKSGCADPEMYLIPETLSSDERQEMCASHQPNLPDITADKLAEADGVLFGIPAQFGAAPTQVEAFFDSLEDVWTTRALHGKCAGVFLGNGPQHGGQRSTVDALLPRLAQHGMLYIPLAYTNPRLHDSESVTAGSPRGVDTVAGSDGSQQPTPADMATAEAQGERFAQVVARLAATAGSAAESGQQPTQQTDHVQAHLARAPGAGGGYLHWLGVRWLLARVRRTL